MRAMPKSGAAQVTQPKEPIIVSLNRDEEAFIGNEKVAAEDLKVLTKREPSAGPIAEEVSDARDAADRVRRIVRDLKTFSRAEEEGREAVDGERVL